MYVSLSGLEAKPGSMIIWIGGEEVVVEAVVRGWLVKRIWPLCVMYLPD